MIFSAGTTQLALVAYVPDGTHNKSAGKVDVAAWMDSVVAAIGGKVVQPAAKADSPKGGQTVTAVAVRTPRREVRAQGQGRRDVRSVRLPCKNGAFPDDDDDDDDDDCASATTPSRRWASRLLAARSARSLS